MKKTMIVIIALALLLTGCGLSDGATKEKPLRVLMPFQAQNISPRDSGQVILDLFAKQFSQLKGKEVELVFIDAASQEEYTSKRNSLLLSDESPDLFFVGNAFRPGDMTIGVDESYQTYVNIGLAADLRDLPSYQELFKGLRYKYFAPIGISVPSKRLEAGLVKKLLPDQEVSVVLEKSLEEELYQELFNRGYRILGQGFIFEKLYELRFDLTTFIEPGKDEVHLVGQDQLKKYEAFKKELASFKQGEDPLFDQDLVGLYTARGRDYRDLTLNVLNGHEIRDPGEAYFYHYVPEDVNVYYAAGLVVNRASDQLEEALKFADFSMSHFSQVTMYHKTKTLGSTYSGVVNRIALEHISMDEQGLPFFLTEDKNPLTGEIADVMPEMIEAREAFGDEYQDRIMTYLNHVYERLDEEKLFYYNDISYRFGDYLQRIENLIFTYVFSEDYTLEDLEQALRKLEGEMNLILIEE